MDPQGIMLMGLSMGGLLAPRAAAYEHRLRICIANPGVMDWSEVFFGQLEEYSPELLSMYEALTSKKDYMLFTEAEAASLHVQTGSLSLASQRIFDWIDDELGRVVP